MADSIIIRPRGYIAQRAADAAAVMRQGDTTSRVDNLIRRQLAAESAYARIAHRAWSKFPQHTAAEGLAALQRHVVGDTLDKGKFLGLAWLGELLALHRTDWEGRENEVGARLRSSSENFLGCLFELESSHLARSWGHQTTWLWPTNPAGADILIDGRIAGECVHASKATEALIPAAALHEFGQALSTAMQRHGRNLDIRLIVPGRVGSDLGTLRDVLIAAVAQGTVGVVPLPLPGYSATVEELAPLDAPISVEQADALLQFFGQFANKFGTVERSPFGYPRNPRFVVIEAPGGTPAIASAARSAAEKHRQIASDIPTVVWVKFGQPIDSRQASDPLVGVAVAQEVRTALLKRKAHRVSGVVWVFNCGVLFPPAGHGFLIFDPGRDPAEDRQPQFRTFYISNPDADRPLAEDCLIPSGI